MTHYLRHLPATLLLLACFFVNGCSDDKPEPDLPEPGTGMITLTEFELPLDLADIRATSIVLHIKNRQTGANFQEETSFARFATFLRFRLQNGLPDGEYMMMSATYRPEGSDQDVEAAMGMSVAITKGALTVLNKPDPKYGFYGKGTERDPYQISSVTDLNRLKSFVNDDRNEPFAGVFFKQQKTLDLGVQDKTTGWEPVGNRPNSPFSGVYDGGGYEIKSLWIETPALSGKGLFGFSRGALFRNITFTGTVIKADGFAGSLVGVVMTGGSTRDLTEIANCHIKTANLTGDIGVGGLVGTVDESAVLYLHGCSNAGTIKGTIGIGGLVGLGVVSSYMMVDSCDNKGSITGVIAKDFISGIGGVVGAADTLGIFFSHNTGTVTAPVNATSRGIGGIAGSSGIALFSICRNEKNISGGRGVGGILGSTVVEMEDEKTDASYNIVACVGCVNGGGISAFQTGGGIVGESQSVIESCYNTATVKSTNYYAGGIVGYSPSLMGENCLNTGAVSAGADGAIGGIAGYSMLSQVLGCYNFGRVGATGKNAVVGGVVGYTGNMAAIHYSGNYGQIWHTGVSGAAGGVAGTLGCDNEFTKEEKCTILIAGLSIAGGAAYYAQVFGVSKKAMGAVRAGILVVKIPEYWVTFSSSFRSFIASRRGLVNPRPGTPFNEDEMRMHLTEAINRVQQEKQSLYNTQLNKLTDQTDMNKAYATSQQMFCQRLFAEETYADLVNENMNASREARYEKHIERKENMEFVYKIAKGVATVCAVAAFVGGMIVTAGTGAALAIAYLGTVGGFLGGSTAILQVASDFEENASVIEQSFNQGGLDISNPDIYAGGITGKLNDWGLIRNCYNTGSLSKYEDNHKGGITGYLGDRVAVKHTVNYALWNGNPKYGTAHGWGSGSSIANCSVYYLAERPDESGGYTAAQLTDPSTYQGFLDDNYWNLNSRGFPTHTGRSYFEDNKK